jgi:hypothetical protein
MDFFFFFLVRMVCILHTQCTVVIFICLELHQLAFFFRIMKVCHVFVDGYHVWVGGTAWVVGGCQISLVVCPSHVYGNVCRSSSGNNERSIEESSHTYIIFHCAHPIKPFLLSLLLCLLSNDITLFLKTFCCT